MQNQPIPVLIFAQSGRFIAQLASQAGYRVWLADCFCDQDALNIAERWQKLQPIQQLTEQQILATFSTLSQGENCLLVYGSGIELHYPILGKLPANIKLIGNTATTVDTIQTPIKFFSLLNQLNLAYPDTQFEQTYDSDWLTKSPSGFGGTHIQYAKQQSDGHYYQRYIVGTSGSGLFLANGKQAKLLSINQHYLHSSDGSPFRLGSITSPWLIATQHRQQLALAINKLTCATGLSGINSIDFIISKQNQFLILEINPRISASAELLDSTACLFEHHITSSSSSGVFPEATISQATSPSILSYIYAEHTVTIPSDIIWPLACHDLPNKGVTIQKDDPIYTLRLRAETTKILQCHHKKFLHNISLQLNKAPYSSSSKL